ncbi:MAG: 16S rRNA (uracil(1498)-N(3))-methyltransferase [Bacteroidales bacterium]
MDLFYKTNIVSEHLILDPDESAHSVKVLRYGKGDRVRLIDGKGGFYVAEIEHADPTACEVRIISKSTNHEKLPYELHIAIAPTKRLDRFEWFVEKATEIGVSSITPLFCQRSERRNIRLDRIKRVAIAAMKQSVKAYLPRIFEPIGYSDWIETRVTGSKFIAHCMDGAKMDIRTVELSDAITIIIGPEGDFTPEEVMMAIQNDYEPLSLGDYRLRTETAGVVACSAVYLKATR